MAEKQLNDIRRQIANVDSDEIDLIAFFRKIIDIRKTLYKVAGIALVIGIIIWLSIPKQYTVGVTLSPEMKDSKGNSGLAGLAASFLGSNATMNDGFDALNISLSADIVSSTPFLLELFDVKVVTSKGVDFTLNTYLETLSSPWWSHVIRFPGIVVNYVISLFNDTNVADNAISRRGRGAIELSKEERGKIGYLNRNIGVSIDKKTAITSIYVTMQDPKVSAIVADSVIRKLQEYIISYRTTKAKEDYVYLEEVFKERREEYYKAQKEYANYVDSHDNLILQSVRAEQERLQNDMGIAYQVYSQVANQLQIARAKVQEEKPVFAIVEPAVIPEKPSGKWGIGYILITILGSVVCAIGWILYVKPFWSQLRSEIRNK